MTAPHPPLPIDPTKRALLARSVGLLIAVGFANPTGSSATGRVLGAATRSGATTLPGEFVAINADNTAIIYCNKPDMGQGTLTSLPRLLAEELDLPWDSVTVAMAPVRPPFTTLGDYEADGSNSIRDLYIPLRTIGAALRQLFIEAAARRWGIPSSACESRAGTVVERSSGRSIRYSELAHSIVGQNLPKSPVLKAAADFALIGKSAPNVQTSSVVDGSLRYGLDLDIRGALTALIARAPNSHAHLAGFDAGAARRLPGVKFIDATPDGVAIVADSFFAAKLALDATTVHWTVPVEWRWSSDGIRAELERRLLAEPTFVVIDDCAAATAPPQAPEISATYFVPYQPHAAMEPASCIASVRRGICDLWVGTQAAVDLANDVATALGLAPAAIHVHPQPMGGAFGRKGESDVAIEAAQLSRKLNRPVKVVWLREDEMMRGPHRPCQLARLSATVRADGVPDALKVALAGPSYAMRTEAAVERRRSTGRSFDNTTLEGLVPLLYPVPRQRVDQHWCDFGVSTGPWRSTSHSMVAFFRECFVDELAVAAGLDPIAFRIRWLQSGESFPSDRLPKRAYNPPVDPARTLRVLEAVQRASHWATRLAAGRGRGVSLQFAYDAYAAVVAEVEVGAGAIQVSRIWLAADVGSVVNPNTVDQQLRGGLLFGLSATFAGLTIAEGAVVERNFDTYPLPRMGTLPDVHVEILASEQPPAGVGETSVPLVAPAIANAVFAATGQRLRELPLRLVGA